MTRETGLLFLENVGAVTWALAILFSFYGWGAALRSVVPANTARHWAVTSMCGVGVLVGIGGILNLLHMAGATVGLAMVGIGVVVGLIHIKAFLADVAADWRWLTSEKRWHKVFAILLLCRLALAVYEEGSEPRIFLDDDHAYMAQVAKISQTGTLGRDPFSERRMSSLGGQPFLLSLVAAAVDVRHLRLLDGGIGLILLAGVMAGFLRTRGVGPFASLIILTWCVILPPTSLNMTTVTLGAAAFGCFWWMLMELEVTNRAAFLLVAIVAGGIVALKSTLAPVVGLTLLFYLVLSARETGIAKAIQIAATMAAAILVQLICWMWEARTSNGSWFYPFLGKGWHGTVQGLHMFDPWTLDLVRRGVARVAREPTFFCGMVLPFIAWSRTIDARARRTILFAGISSAVGCLATLYATRATEIRYTLPYLDAATMLALGILFAGAGFVSLSARSRRFAFCVVVAFVAAHGLSEARRLKFSFIHGIPHPEHLVEQAYPPSTHRLAQNSIPSGATFLEHVTHSYLFDFRRNPVLVCDLPGGSSPPPGLPLEEHDAEKMAQYLTRTGVRYVLFAYKHRPLMPPWWVEGGSKPDFEYQGPWAKHQLSYTYEFQQRLLELSRTRKILYENAELRALDLATPAK